MDIERIDSKLDTFATMVIKDATHKAGMLLNQASEENRESLEDAEISFLRDAYYSIHEAVNKIEKENNEVYSAKLFEAKQLLFIKRQQILEAVFNGVKDRLEKYRMSGEYTGRLESFLCKGLNEVGAGEVQVFVDSIDLACIQQIQKRLNQSFSIRQNDEPLMGGCIVVNQTTGLMADYSFSSRLEQQREVFLENSGMNINL
ncbi:MAG: V-type ATP synthase subunit E [Thermoclostridium sp.]|nr:V-type ATP synthase subunit E [Thermoclostridium sp.]